jgi:hypothetical protein
MLQVHNTQKKKLLSVIVYCEIKKYVPFYRTYEIYIFTFFSENGLVDKRVIFDSSKRGFR